MKGRTISSSMHNFFLQNKRSGILFQKFLLCIAAFCLFLPKESSATHISGAELSYKWISGNDFEITLTLYRDCSGISAPNSVSINYRSVSCGYNLNSTLTKIAGTGLEITHPCSSTPTNCNGGTSPGIQKYEYKNNITLPAQCSDWTFGYTICCRNCAITTLSYTPNNCSGVPATYVEATMNNVLEPHNSSPIFTNDPVSFFCIGQAFHYNHGAFDSNGDSLVYSFVDPKSAIGTNVVFNPGFSASNPISSSPPITLNSNGDLLIHPTSMEVGVMDILVKEYRNGVLIGSVVRDMQVWTNSCTNNLPTASGINGSNDYNSVICPGSTVSISINSYDADVTQAISMEWNQAIPGASFTVSGATHPTGTFTWTPTAADVRTLPYIFTITVQDDNCPSNGFQTYSYAITVQNMLASVVATNSNCSGSGTGTATAFSTGEAPFQYVWSPGSATSVSISGLSTGTYSATVTDANGCVATASGTVTAPPPVGASILTLTNPSCYGASNGSMVVMGNGGSPPYTYAWTPNNSVTPFAIGLPDGAYSVKVTDRYGCTHTMNSVISQPPQLTASLNSTNLRCFNDASGGATITTTGGTAPYNYSWSNGSTASFITNVQAGNYSVKITDALGCNITSSVVIDQPAELNGSIFATTSVSCAGNSNGSGSVMVTGGSPPYHFIWSPYGGTNSSASGLTAGNYTVTVSDNNNCTSVVALNISEPFPLASAITRNVSCNGGSDGSAAVTMSGGSSPFNYEWLPLGGNDSIADSLIAGNYIVQITDAYNCTLSLPVTINEPPGLTSAVFTTMMRCAGDGNATASVSASGGTGTYSYLWLPGGQISQSISSLNGGDYTIVVTDQNGCSASTPINIAEPTPLIVTVSATQAGCNLSNGGVAASVSGGTIPYRFAWNPGGYTTAAVNGLPAGAYNVTVTDFNNCVSTSTVAVTNPTGPASSLLSSTPATCYGGADGTAIIQASGGTAPFQYLWSPAGGSSNSAGNLSAGNYSVVVRDANNCVSAVPFSIDGPTVIRANISTTATNCNGGNDGVASASVSGGYPPYNFLWSNGETSPTAFGLSAGTHNLNVTDVKGCSISFDAIVSEPSAITLDVDVSPVICNSRNSGFASAIPSGGTPGYTYLWSNGYTYPWGTNFFAGNYSVTITDAHGCTADTSVTITEPAKLVVDAFPINTSCSNLRDGSATVVVTGGVPPYTYEWTPYGGTADSTFNLGTGGHAIKVTDANGCMTKDDFWISAPPPLTLSASTAPTKCYGQGSGDGDVTAFGGTPPYSYLWSNGATTASVDDLPGGAYTVVVTDSKGCTTQGSGQITEPTPLNLTMQAPSTSCIGQQITLIAECSGGTPPYRFIWDDGSPSPQRTLTPSGTATYFVTVLDANTCLSNLAASVVTINPPLLASFTGPDTICMGEFSRLEVQVNGGGGGPYNYSWNNGETTGQITVMPIANTSYSVTVNDNCGTPPSIAVTNVVVNPNPTASFLPHPVHGCQPLTVTFTDHSSSDAAEYFWNFGDGNSDSTRHPSHVYVDPGIYTVNHLVTTRNGCSGRMVVSEAVTVYPLPVADFNNVPEVASVYSPSISFFNSSSNSSGFEWNFGDGSPPATDKNTEHSYKDTGLYIVRLISTSDDGCIDTTFGRVMIRGEFAFYIPNAFTPNGDGVNEIFSALGIGVQDYEMSIFDRWGLKIYYSTDLAKGWNGREAGSGIPCQADVYVYKIHIIDLQGNPHSYIGRVNLVR